MPAKRQRRYQFSLNFTIAHDEAVVLFHILGKHLGHYWHLPDGCTTNECPCYANGYRDGYEDGRQAEQEEPTGEPIRNEGWD